jgi:hypothetical protein
VPNIPCNVTWHAAKCVALGQSASLNVAGRASPLSRGQRGLNVAPWARTAGYQGAIFRIELRGVPLGLRGVSGLAAPPPGPQVPGSSGQRAWGCEWLSRALPSVASPWPPCASPFDKLNSPVKMQVACLSTQLSFTVRPLRARGRATCRATVARRAQRLVVRAEEEKGALPC